MEFESTRFDRFVPDQPEAAEWDVIVIGTGMGGAVTGFRLAELGHRVLFVEKGPLNHLEGPGQDTAPANSAPAGDLLQGADASDPPSDRLRRGEWPLRIQGRRDGNALEFFAPLGCGSGGSTSLYAAALERFFPADFAPRSNFTAVRDSTLPDRWPVAYEELEPYYWQAEKLFRVRGTHDPKFPAGKSCLLEPPPLSPRDQHFADSFGSRGLHPYRVHVGYEFVPGCTECAGQLCLKECKNDAARICLLPALRRHGAKVLPDCEVVELKSSKSGVREVRCVRAGIELSLKARIVVLAAGALMSPVLLLKSRSESWPNGLANESGLVGRNLMFHLVEWVLVKPLGDHSTKGPQKCLAFNDLYQTAAGKFGTIQTAISGVSPVRIMKFIRDSGDRSSKWWMRLAGSRPVWWRRLTSPFVRLAAFAAWQVLGFRSASIWAGVIEDLPYSGNRVVYDPSANAGMRFEYRYSRELMERVAAYRHQLRKVLAPHKVAFLTGDDNLNYGHSCGTCRFGDDPATSVLDRHNKAHGIDNLYVVDASFFPSSGGTNPSLTIAANGLRVAGFINEQLRGGASGPGSSTGLASRFAPEAGASDPAANPGSR